MIVRRRLACIAVACLLLARPANGGTIYVASGAATNATFPSCGASAASPCGSLKQVCESAAAGDAVQVAAGSSFGPPECGIRINNSLTVAATIAGDVTLDCGGRPGLSAFVIVPPATTVRLAGMAVRGADQAVKVSATGATVILEHNTFSGCRTAFLGAALYFGVPGHARLLGNAFVNNTAVAGGGAVYLADDVLPNAGGGTLNVTGNTFRANTAGTRDVTAWGGGALYVRTQGALVVHGNRFDENSLLMRGISPANGNGYAGGAMLVLSYTYGDGGGRAFEFADNVFSANAVQYLSGPGTHGGGALLFSVQKAARGDSHAFRNNTFVGNRVSSTGFAHAGALAWRVASVSPSLHLALQDVNISLISNHFIRNEVVG
eukprot:g5825.t1